MKKLILTIVVLSLGSVISNANVLYFYGKVDSVGTNPLIRVGDAVAIAVTYNASNNTISQINASVNNSELQLVRQPGEMPLSHVIIDGDPVDGTVQWAVLDSNVMSADAASNTPGGVVPCIDNFDLGRVFSIFFNGIIANGTITSAPRSRTGN